MCGSSCRLLVLSPPGPGRPAHPTSTHLASVAHGPAPAFILPRHRGLLPAPAPPRGCRVCLGRFPTFPGLIPSALCVKESPKHNTEPHPVPSRPLPQSPSPPLLPRKGPPSAFPGRCSRTWSHLQGETHAPRRGLHARSRHTFLVFFPLCRCCSNLLQLVPVTFAVREEK